MVKWCSWWIQWQTDTIWFLCKWIWLFFTAGLRWWIWWDGGRSSQQWRKRWQLKPFVDYEQSMPAQPQSSVSELYMESFEDNKGWLPFSEPILTVHVSPSTLDLMDKEIMHSAFMYLGYLCPLPAPQRPTKTDMPCQKSILRVLGFSWCNSSPALFARARILAIIKFLENMSGNDWDLMLGSRLCVTSSACFWYIGEIRGPHGSLFMFDFLDHSTIKWKLTLRTAAHALLVCCLHPELWEQDIAMYLVRSGIPFYTLQDVETLAQVSSALVSPWSHPFCPANHVFTLADYVVYHDDCSEILAQPQSRAALLQGGYLWKVAISGISFDCVTKGPTGYYADPAKMFIVTLPNGQQYVDDMLPELDILCLLGMYNCGTGMSS